MNARTWIERLALTPHPEGGFYAETYRASFEVSPVGEGLTSAVTSIHYLLEAGDFSGFHRIAYPELWYFHDASPGTSLALHEIDAAGHHRVRYLGAGLGADSKDVLSLAVEPGVWFAAEVVAGAAGRASRSEPEKPYVLVSCAVAPGFRFEIFEMARREAMLREFPQHAEVLQRLCRE